VAVEKEADRSVNVGAEDAGSRILQAAENLDSRQAKRIA
jgi:hypothetical protein